VNNESANHAPAGDEGKNRVNRSPLGILADSAIVLAAVSALLYFWGFVTETFLFLEQGLPQELLPERSVQYYLSLGGMLALFFVLPLTIVVFLVITIVRKLIGAKTNLWTSLNYAVPLAAILFTLFGVPFVPDLIIRTTSKTLRVKSISMSSESKISTKYDGLIFVTKKGSNYVFVDKISEEGASTFILNESEVKELVLAWSNQ
jgi:hypothetical protein